MRTWTPVIETHAVAAVVAVIIGLSILIAKKGTATHRFLGRLWWLAMIVTVLSSFAIQELGGLMGWSWIHLLSIYTLLALIMAIIYIRRGNVAAHRWTMLVSLAGLLIAGTFASLPGRRMGDLLNALI
jgi:uncharacterized membrane protein